MAKSAGPSLEDLQGNKRTIQIRVGDGDPITVVYRPNMLDENTWKRIRTTPEGASSQEDRVYLSNMAPAFVIEVVAEWNLRRKASDPEPITINRKELATVPTPLLVEIMNQINADARPNPTPSAISENGS